MTWGWNTKKGFTLIELLVVIAIIGILASVVLAELSTARGRARDAKRLSDMNQIRLALELFFEENGHYPGTPEGVATGGEKIGDNNGALEQALAPYLPVMPADPLHDGSTYFYAYDPQHCVSGGGSGGASFGFNRSETHGAIRNETNGCGGDQQHNTADYVEVLHPQAP